LLFAEKRLGKRLAANREILGAAVKISSSEMESRHDNRWIVIPGATALDLCMVYGGVVLLEEVNLLRKY
jgi:hypothetical protein